MWTLVTLMLALSGVFVLHMLTVVWLMLWAAYDEDHREELLEIVDLLMLY